MALTGLASLKRSRRSSRRTKRIGVVSAEAAAATGLPPGAAVFGGAADHIASALAAGLTDAGDVLLKFGGAGDVIAIAERAEPDRRLFLDYHLVPGLYAPNGCMAASGSLLRWLAALIGGGLSLAELDAEAAAVSAGAEGVRMLPYFLGEKTPIHDALARGTITGLSLSHGRGHIWRAALEAIACGFRHHLDVLADQRPYGATPLRLRRRQSQRCLDADRRRRLRAAGLDAGRRLWLVGRRRLGRGGRHGARTMGGRRQGAHASARPFAPRPDAAASERRRLRRLPRALRRAAAFLPPRRAS